MTNDIGAQLEFGEVDTPEDRAAVFELRIRVFVEEQNVPIEEELDAYDVTATHFFVRLRDLPGLCKEEMVATARLVDRGSGIGKIGRVAVCLELRGSGIGAALMRYVEEFARGRGYSRLELEAQFYAIPFYEKLGYAAEGEVFLDANIQHRHMWKFLTGSADSAGGAQVV